MIWGALEGAVDKKVVASYSPKPWFVLPVCDTFPSEPFLLFSRKLKLSIFLHHIIYKITHKINV